MLASSVFVDVVASVARPPIIDEVLLDWNRLLASRGWFLVDRHLSLILRWLGALLRGRPSPPGG
jgi:hypothetical protein